MDVAKIRLENIYSEYIDFKNYLQKNIKTPKEIQEEVAQKIKENPNLSPQELSETVFNISEKQTIYKYDFNELHKQLFYTVVAYKDVIEIPEEVELEAYTYKPNRVFRIKNGVEEVIDEQVKKDILNSLQENYNNIINFFQNQAS
jgi:hypothetical protein